MINKYFTTFVYIAILFLCLVSSTNAQQLLWVRTFDSGDPDCAQGVTTDIDGNIIVTGSCSYTVKYSPGGDTLWTRQNDIVVSGIACDSCGNIFIGGTKHYNDTTRICIIKYDPEGNLLWEKLSRGEIILSGNRTGCLALDSESNIIVVSVLYQNWGDYITLKYDPEGNLLWKRTYDGGWEDFSQAVTVDGSDNIIVTGYSDSDINWDWCTIKYSPEGEILWIRRYDVAQTDWAFGVTTDKEGNVIVVGDSHTLLPGTGGSSGMIVKYTPDGDTLWTKICTDTLQYEEVYELVDVVTDDNGNIYIAGTYGRWEQAGRIWKDYYVAKLDSSGNTFWTFLYNYNGEDKISAITRDKYGNIFATGSTDAGISVIEEKFLTIKIKDIIVDIDDKNHIPQEYKLYQNYPNPFNSITNIKYQLPVESFVSLRIYNLTGKEVETLVSEKKSAGIYTINWNAEEFYNGLYIARLTTDHGFLSMKFVLIK